MNNQASFYGLAISCIFHSLIFLCLFYAYQSSELLPTEETEQIEQAETSLSLAMFSNLTTEETATLAAPPSPKAKSQPQVKPKPKPQPIPKPRVKEESNPITNPSQSVQTATNDTAQDSTATDNLQTTKTTSGAGSSANGASSNHLGSAASMATAINDYRRRLIQAIEQNKSYPEKSKSKGETGITAITFKLNEDGSIEKAFISESSGYGTIDNAALVAVQQTKSIGKRPSNMKNKQTIRIQFIFHRG